MNSKFSDELVCSPSPALGGAGLFKITSFLRKKTEIIFNKLPAAAGGGQNQSRRLAGKKFPGT